MGYRSDIRVMTDLEGFEEMQEIAWELKDEKNLSDDVVLFPMQGQDPDNFFDYYDAQEDYLCFGLDWVKWYDNFQDVGLFMDTLKVANDNGVKWQFMRVGEEWGDVEEESSDNFYNNPVAVMGVRTEITY